MRGRKSNAVFASFVAVIGPILLYAPDASASELDAAKAEYPAEIPFLTENAAAMDKMMAGMDVKPTGDADADFVAMMIPHHQGAIDMAVAELRYGKNEQLRRIAQEIIVDQQQEIPAMRLALGQRLPPAAPAPTQISRSDAAQPSGTAGHDHTSPGSAPPASAAAPMQMK